MKPDETLSPALLRKVTHAATCSASFEQAAENLRELAEVNVSARRVQRAALCVGHERLADRQDQARAYQRLPLPAQQQTPGPPPPAVACIQADGGRIQIRPRARAASLAPDSWWRETKVGCLLSLTSDQHDQDPTPRIPETFVDPERMAKISGEIKGFSGDAAPRAAPPEQLQPPPQAPRVSSQTVVATTANVQVFGEMLAAQAHALGFAAAERKAFVADGSEANWGLWRRHFSHYTPILDFVHAVCYVYAAAMAGVSVAEGWTAYCQWAQCLWSGQVDRILEQLRARQATIGLPRDDDAETSPRNRLADALRYLENQRTRMNYPEYRRRGLPITSSHVESTIKRVNRRMKGTEKFWDQGAEPLLCLVADHLSPPEAREAYWSHRPSRLSSQRRYHQTA